MTTVRPAKAEDAEVICRLLEQMGYPTTPEAVRLKLFALSKSGDTPVFVACIEADVVGVAAVQIGWDLYSPYPKTELTTLVVDDAARRKGVGKILIDHVIGFARENGCRQVDLITALHRAESRQFYTSVGFSESAVRMHVNLF